MFVLIIFIYQFAVLSEKRKKSLYDTKLLQLMGDDSDDDKVSFYLLLTSIIISPFIFACQL